MFAPLLYPRTGTSCSKAQQQPNRAKIRRVNRENAWAQRARHDTHEVQDPILIVNFFSPPHMGIDIVLVNVIEAGDVGLVGRILVPLLARGAHVFGHMNGEVRAMRVWEGGLGGFNGGTH